jgi:glutamine amidotransferase
VHGEVERFEGPLSEVLRSGTPVLGICVGMQVLFERSEENPEARGFSWVPGSVVKLQRA